MKVTVHYTIGYGGELNYHTRCGKEIHSHDKKELATITPEEVTCTKCKKTKEWQEDFKESTEINPNVKRRIFIESDILDASELQSAQRKVRRFCNDNQVEYVSRVFSEVLDGAWHDLEKTWESVKKADEVYAKSSLMPLVGGSYMGAPVIFNGMCDRAVKEKITGKSVFIMNTLDNIDWYMIKIPLMKKAFKKNALYMFDENHNFVKIDVSKIKNK